MIKIDHFIVAIDNKRVERAESWCWRLFICTGNHLYGDRAHYDSYESAWKEVELLLENKRKLTFEGMEMWIGGSDTKYLETLTMFNKQGEMKLGVAPFSDPVFKCIQLTEGVKVENSGGHCEYYHCEVTHPQNHNQTVPYIANCEDIIQALGLTFDEGCEFKSIWRRGRGRQGFIKAESTTVRDASKAVHYAQRVLAFEQRKAGDSND